MRFLLILCVALTCCPQACADGEWVDYCAEGVFVCRSEFPLTQKRQILQELKQLKTDLEDSLHLEVEEKPVQIDLFHDRQSYIRYVSRRYPEGKKRRALYVKGPDAGRIYVYRHRKYHVDLRHETTHALLHHSLPFLPLWLDEGLATYFEVTPEKRASGHSHLRSIRWAIRLGWRPRLTVLERKRNLTDMKQRDYRDSWAWVHFLMHESSQSRHLLVEYLKDIQQGNPPGPLSDRIRQQMPDAHLRLVEHFRKWES